MPKTKAYNNPDGDLYYVELPSIGTVCVISHEPESNPLFISSFTKPIFCKENKAAKIGFKFGTHGKK